MNGNALHEPESSSPKIKSPSDTRMRLAIAIVEASNAHPLIFLPLLRIQINWFILVYFSCPVQRFRDGTGYLIQSVLPILQKVKAFATVTGVLARNDSVEENIIELRSCRNEIYQFLRDLYNEWSLLSSIEI